MTDKTILQGVVGSHAYGLAHEGSDTDRMGIFVSPSSTIAGLDWSIKDETNSISGVGVDDHASHEVRKFIRLALKSNPTVSELLWIDEYETSTWEGRMVVSARKEFLSHSHVKNAYFGYAKAQLDKFHNHDFKVKHARHALRLLQQGHSALATGEIVVKVANPKEFFDLNDMKSGAILDLLGKEFLRYTENNDPSPLPEEPNKDAARDIIATIRHFNH